VPSLNGTPLRPGPLHVAYTLAVAAVAGGYGVMVAYTMSQPWAGPLPQGVIAFDSTEAAGLGQTCAFVLDLRRLAYPATHGSLVPASREGGCRCARTCAEGVAGSGERDNDRVGETAVCDFKPERTTLGTMTKSNTFLGKCPRACGLALFLHNYLRNLGGLPLNRNHCAEVSEQL